MSLNHLDGFSIVLDKLRSLLGNSDNAKQLLLLLNHPKNKSVDF